MRRSRRAIRRFDCGRLSSITNGRRMTERARSKSRPENVNGKEPKPYVMECQVGFLMRVAMQRHTSIFMSLMPHNLTQTQFAVVAKLAEVGTTSQNQLGRLVCLDAATTKGVVDRLRIRKIVTIEINPRDRRHSMVSFDQTRCAYSERIHQSRPPDHCQDSCPIKKKRAANDCTAAPENVLSSMPLRTTHERWQSSSPAACESMFGFVDRSCPSQQSEIPSSLRRNPSRTL